MPNLDITQLNLNQTHVIEASAGTGKTHAIVSIFLRLVAEGYRIDQILVVTFTEAATAELRDRIRTRLRESLGLLNQTGITDPLMNYLISTVGMNVIRRRFQQAVMTFDEAAVFTIHGFCSQILQTHAFESDILFDARLQAEPGTLFEDIAADFWAKTVYSAPEFMVQSLIQNRVVPATLTDLMRLVSGKPEIHIIPDRPDSITPPGRNHPTVSVPSQSLANPPGRNSVDDGNINGCASCQILQKRMAHCLAGYHFDLAFALHAHGSGSPPCAFPSVSDRTGVQNQKRQQAATA